MLPPINFDGARFARKFSLGKHDFIIDGSGNLFYPTHLQLSGGDLLDCVVPSGEQEARLQQSTARDQKLFALAEWLRVQAKDVREHFQDIVARLDADEERFLRLETWAKTKGYPG